MIRVLNALDKFNLTKNTLVLFTSDNGPEVSPMTRLSNNMICSLLIQFEFNTIATKNGVGSVGPFKGRKRSLFEV